MSEDTIGRLFEKVDSICDRLARVETLMRERNRRESEVQMALSDLAERVRQLERGESALTGGRGLMVWLFTMAVALYGVMR